MARSIHTTRRHLREAEAEEHRDAQRKDKRVRTLAADLERKHQIKRQVHWDRRGGDARPGPDLDPVPIRVIDEGPWIHYPADEACLRAVIERLPRGALDGLREIRLELGDSTQREVIADRGDEIEEVDPWLGRPGEEILPGVWVGECTGTYHSRSRSIALYAFVMAEDPTDGDPVEVLLRLDMLATFVHEVAHHHDCMHRVARGRWLAHGDSAVEHYAEHQEHHLVREVVIPCLRSSFPDEVAALDRWLQELAGTSLSLEAIAGDPRVTSRQEGAFFWRHSLWEGLSEVVRARREGLDILQSRVGLAWDLHLTHRDDAALDVVRGVLAEAPDHPRALILDGHLLKDSGRLDQAAARFREVLAKHPGDKEALRERLSLEREARRWSDLVDTADELIEAGECYLFDRGSRARALLELERWDELDEALTWLEHHERRPMAAEVAALRALAALRRGRPAEALEISEQGLREQGQHIWARLLLAVRADALHQLGEQAAVLDPSVLDWLETMGFEVLVQRLRMATSSP